MILSCVWSLSKDHFCSWTCVSWIQPVSLQVLLYFFKKRTSGNLWNGVFTSFMSSCHLSRSVSSKGTQSTIPSHWLALFFILYSFTTRLLIEGALLTLCHLSDGSTCSWAVINILLFVIVRLPYNKLLIYKRLLLLVRNMHSHRIHTLMMISNEHYLITVFYRP